MKLYRYISASKLAMLENPDTKVTGGGFSILGSGANIRRQSRESITSRLERVVDGLTAANVVRELGEGDSNFIIVSGQFVEALMNGVVVWVSVQGDTTLLLGGSSAYINFDNFSGPEEPGLISGSNRTGVLNALTMLWRVVVRDNELLLGMSPQQIDAKESIAGGNAPSKVFDSIPHNVAVVAPSLGGYYEDATKTFRYYDDSMVDNLEILAVVFTDHTFPQSSIFEGKRFLVGSPIYVAQKSPAGGGF